MVDDLLPSLPNKVEATWLGMSCDWISAWSPLDVLILVSAELINETSNGMPIVVFTEPISTFLGTDVPVTCCCWLRWTIPGQGNVAAGVLLEFHSFSGSGGDDDCGLGLNGAAGHKVKNVGGGRLISRHQ